MNKKLVGPERKIKQTDIYGLAKKFHDGKATIKQVILLQNVLDMDYLVDIMHDEEARKFMGNFIGEWTACDTGLRTKETEAARRARMRDITAQYKRIDLNLSPDGETVEDFTTVAATKTQSLTHEGANPATIPDPNLKVRSDYTLRDYMPSLKFNPDAIIENIDNQRMVAKLKKRGR